MRETNKRSRSARETEPKTDDVHDDAEDQEEDAEDEVSHDEEDHDETDDGEEIDEDDPVAMLIAQGVSEEMAKGALGRRRRPEGGRGAPRSTEARRGGGRWERTARDHS